MLRPQITGLTRPPALTRRAFLGGVTAGAVVLAAGQPARAGHHVAPDHVRSLGPQAATSWIRTLYDVVMAEGLTPPAAARFYHYSAVSMYEVATAVTPGYRSLAGQLTGLRRVPPARGPIDVPVAMSVAVSSVAVGLLPTASQASLLMIDARLRAAVDERRGSVRNRHVLAQSAEYGHRVARHLLEWIAGDGYAEASTTPYTPPIGPDLWRSTPPNFGTAIEPHWHRVRPAVLASPDEVEPLPPIAFSTAIGSRFHEQAMATYRQSSLNTAEQIAIARFWTDNPRLSGLPSGHWFLLLAQLSESPLGLDLGRTLEGFARLGTALHDAFLNCWTWKYRYNLIRPVSYIRDHVDPGWSTVVNTPQFPEYTSGHSVGSGAAEIVLTSLFGAFPFVDSTAAARSLGERSFTSFTHAAEEAAISRLYGGIHYPMGIEHGVAQGRELGRLVDARLRTRPRH